MSAWASRSCGTGRARQTSNLQTSLSVLPRGPPRGSPGRQVLTRKRDTRDPRHGPGTRFTTAVSVRRLRRVQRWRGLEAVPTGWGRSVVTVGVFDGVHRGHQKLINRTVERGRARGLPRVLVTSTRTRPRSSARPPPSPADEPAPARRAGRRAGHRRLLRAARSPPSCSAWRPPRSPTRCSWTGCTPPRSSSGGTSPSGTRPRGTSAMLTGLGARFGFGVEGLDLMTNDGVTVSSTYIRACIDAGDVAAATAALGRPHRIEGVVVHGEHRGRELGFPTANIATAEWTALPADGVYAGISSWARGGCRRRSRWAPTRRLGPGAHARGVRPRRRRRLLRLRRRGGRRALAARAGALPDLDALPPRYAPTWSAPGRSSRHDLFANAEGAGGRLSASGHGGGGAGKPGTAARAVRAPWVTGGLLTARLGVSQARLARARGSPGHAEPLVSARRVRSATRRCSPGSARSTGGARRCHARHPRAVESCSSRSRGCSGTGLAGARAPRRPRGRGPAWDGRAGRLAAAAAALGPRSPRSRRCSDRRPALMGPPPLPEGPGPRCGSLRAATACAAGSGPNLAPDQLPPRRHDVQPHPHRRSRRPRHAGDPGPHRLRRLRRRLGARRRPRRGDRHPERIGRPDVRCRDAHPGPGRRGGGPGEPGARQRFRQRIRRDRRRFEQRRARRSGRQSRPVCAQPRRSRASAWCSSPRALCTAHRTPRSPSPAPTS